MRMLLSSLCLASVLLPCIATSAQTTTPCPPPKPDGIKVVHDFEGFDVYAKKNQDLPPPAQGEKRVVFMGDSIFFFWNLPHFFPGKPYIDRGIMGQSTPEMLLRFEQDVIHLNPSVVVLLAGTNDLASYYGPVSPAQIEDNYDSMVQIARGHGIKVVLATITPVSDYKGPGVLSRHSTSDILKINAWIKDYCKRTHITYLDYFDSLVDSSGFMRRDLSDDGLHPNNDGFAIMTPLTSKAIKDALRNNDGL
jgi:lysophospholipase L1-like esterase